MCASRFGPEVHSGTRAATEIARTTLVERQFPGYGGEQLRDILGRLRRRLEEE